MHERDTAAPYRNVASSEAYKRGEDRERDRWEGLIPASLGMKEAFRVFIHKRNTLEDRDAQEIRDLEANRCSSIRPWEVALFDSCFKVIN